MDKHNADIDDLVEHVFADLQKSKKLYYQPERKILKELFKCLYFASMNSEEGEMIKVRVAFYDPDELDITSRRQKVDRWNYIPFDKPRPFEIKTIVKLSKSVDPWSGSLAVYGNEDQQLMIYGLIDQAVHSESFLNRETANRPEQAGLFQVSITGIGCLSVIRDYDLVATLKQDVLVTEFVDALRFGPLGLQLRDNAAELIAAIGAFIKKGGYDYSYEKYSLMMANMVRDTISRLLIHIRNYHHGGALLITNSEENIKINYKIKYPRLKNAMVRVIKATIDHNETIYEVNEAAENSIPNELFDDYVTTSDRKKAVENELKGAIRFVASHSCVDGLILLNTHSEEIGYGALIQHIEVPKYIYHAQDNLGDKVEKRSPSHFGTRHQSMISFCSDNPGSIGFVLSQDGDIRAFMQVEDKLMMWENIKTQRYLKAAPAKRPIRRPL